MQILRYLIPIEGVDYSSEIDTTLTISAKQSQINSFQQCAVGDMIVIYQTIRGGISEGGGECGETERLL